MADEVEKSAKKGGGILKKYKWWFVVGAVVLLGIIYVAISKANSATGSGADTASTAASGGINPATGYLYGSPADVAAQGGGGTTTQIPGPVGATGPAGPPGSPGGLDAHQLHLLHLLHLQHVAAKQPNVSSPNAVSAHSTMYTVKPGDNLTKIASNTGAVGGWQSVYAANKNTIGGNPSSVQPGTRLHIP